MASGSTALTVALVPTAMNAGVWIWPCGVEMVPVRPRNAPPLASVRADDGAAVSARRWPMVKEKSDWGTYPFCPTPPNRVRTGPGSDCLITKVGGQGS
jgi:hypothetical protein